MLIRYRILTAIQKKVGVLAKDTSVGPFVDLWRKTYSEISKEVEEVDVTLALSSAALAVKDEKELVCSSSAQLPTC